MSDPTTRDPSASGDLATWLRDAYRDPAAGCPPPETFLAEELAALTPADLARVEAHAASCAACRAERELARAFDRGVEEDAHDVDWVVARLRGDAAGAATEPASPSAPALPGNAPVPSPVAYPRRRLTPAWTRLAAAVALVAGVGLAVFTLHDSSPPLPEPPRGGPVRGGEVTGLIPNGELAEMPRELRWEPVAGAGGYRVRILTVDGTPVWETSLVSPPAALPADVAARLQRAVSYEWMVEATALDGAILARSATARLRVRPEPEPAERAETPR